MAVVPYSTAAIAAYGTDPGALLCTALGGNVASTNVMDRGILRGGGACIINSVAGATPTVTVNLQGSMDGVNFFNVPYALVATPRTFVLTALTIVSTVITTYLLQELIFWRYFQLVMSANTNVTLTANAWSV